MDGYDPWHDLAERGDVELVFEELPGRRRGEVDFESRTIRLHPRLRPAERRCTLTHELVHLERGPVLVRQAAREERAVRAITARRLVTFEALADVMAWTDDERIMAEELRVDPRTMRVRIGSLTAAEQTTLRRAIGADR